MKEYLESDCVSLLIPREVMDDVELDPDQGVRIFISGKAAILLKPELTIKETLDIINGLRYVPSALIDLALESDCWEQCCCDCCYGDCCYVREDYEDD